MSGWPRRRERRWRVEAPATQAGLQPGAADAVGVVRARAAQAADVRGLPGGRGKRDPRPADPAGAEPPRALGRRLDQAPGRVGALLVPEGRALPGLLLARLGRPRAEQAALLRAAGRPDRHARAGHRLRGGVLLVRGGAARRPREEPLRAAD